MTSPSKRAPLKLLNGPTASTLNPTNAPASIPRIQPPMPKVFGVEGKREWSRTVPTLMAAGRIHGASLGPLISHCWAWERLCDMHRGWKAGKRSTNEVQQATIAYERSCRVMLITPQTDVQLREAHAEVADAVDPFV